MNTVAKVLPILAALALAPSAQAIEGDGYSKCASKIRTASGFGSLFRDLRVKNVRCIAGAEIARRWIRSVGARVDRGVVPPPAVKRISGWRCRYRYLQGDPNPYVRVICTKGERRIKFYGYS